MSFRHQPFWCEENIWQLAIDPRVGPGERWVVIITGRSGMVAMWAQRAAGSALRPIGWDYHVVLLVRTPERWSIFDLDSTLPCPVDADRWLGATFLPLPSSAEGLAPLLRVVPAKDYHRSFASDRSHMLDPAGAWRHPPPPWPVIGEGSNLSRWIDAEDLDWPGHVFDLVGLRAWLADAENGTPQ